MHNWGEEKFDWQGLDDAGDFIGEWLIKWVRLPVTCIKEKFGTLRVYCSFGWSSFYSIWRPQYMWVPGWYPWRLDLWLSFHTPILRWINKVVVPIHQWAYVWRYKKAVEKWPHLFAEIISMADYGKLFEGKIPGYVHGDFWIQIPPCDISSTEGK